MTVRVCDSNLMTFIANHYSLFGCIDDLGFSISMVIVLYSVSWRLQVSGFLFCCAASSDL